MSTNELLAEIEAAHEDDVGCFKQEILIELRRLAEVEAWVRDNRWMLAELLDEARQKGVAEFNYERAAACRDVRAGLVKLLEEQGDG